MTLPAPFRRLSFTIVAVMATMLLQVAPVAAADGTVVIATVTDSDSNPPPVRFEPAAIVVQVGDSVTWRNADTEGRTFTLVADMNAWETEAIAPGEERTVTFETAGAFIYHSRENEVLTGLVVVEEGAGATATPDGTPTTGPTDPGASPTAAATDGQSPSAAPSGSQPPTDMELPIVGGKGGTSLPIVLMLLFGVLLPISWRTVGRRRVEVRARR